MGFENTENIQAATLKQYRFNSFKPSPKLIRALVEEHNGTRTRAQKVLKGPGFTNWTLKMYQYFDWNLLWECLAFGYPVTAAVALASGAFTNTQKISSNVPTGSILFNMGPHWEKYLGASIDEMTVTIDPTKPTMITYKGVAHEVVTNVAAPTPVAISSAAYNHPVMGLAAVSVNSSPYAKLLSGSITIKFGRKPIHTIVETTDMQRAEEGEVVGSFDFLARYTAHTGSFYENQVNNTSPGGISVVFNDLITDIGTGTPTHPQRSLSIGNPLINEDAELDPEKPEVTQHIKGTFGYSSADASAFVNAYRNELAAAVFVGS